MSNGLPVVRVTEIGEYIHHRSCERRFKLGFNNRELAKQLPFAERLFNPLDPVLQEVGRCRENAWERSLSDAGLTALSRHDQCPPDHQATGWDAFVDRLQGLAPGEAAYAREVAVAGQLGAFQIEGRVDFILVLWDAGQPWLRLVECKASRRDRTYHRIQIALYRLLVQQFLATSAVMAGGTCLTPDLVECVVVRIDERTNESQDILQLAPLNLEMETADITRLLSEDGALSYILSTDLDGLSYQIDAKCDGCVFNVHCLPESARQRKLAMLGVEPSTIRALQSAGIETLDDLADLNLTGLQASQVRLAHGFAENLELLVAKARARRRTLPGGDAHPDTYEVEPLPHSWQSQLPEHEIDGRRLVRVYLCVDYDYTENRIGALSAHVTTSTGSLSTGFHEVQGRWPNPATTSFPPVAR